MITEEEQAFYLTKSYFEMLIKINKVTKCINEQKILAFLEEQGADFDFLSIGEGRHWLEWLEWLEMAPSEFTQTMNVLINNGVLKLNLDHYEYKAQNQVRIHIFPMAKIYLPKLSSEEINRAESLAYFNLDTFKNMKWIQVNQCLGFSKEHHFPFMAEFSKVCK